MRKILFLSFGLFLVISGIACAQKRYPATEAENHVGEYATIVGKVYEVFGSRKGTIFLDIGGRYPNNPFSAVIFSRDASKFGNVRVYQGKTVEITGRIQKYRGTAEIILNDPEQIKVRD